MVLFDEGESGCSEEGRLRTVVLLVSGIDLTFIEAINNGDVH